MQLISIAIEALVLILGLMLALGKKKLYGWGFVITFGIYVIYDLARDNFIPLSIPSIFLSVLFLVASISMLLTALFLYESRE
ncbi:MAG: hypothetical protein ABIH50_06120 [bacterium]